MQLTANELGAVETPAASFVTGISTPLTFPLHAMAGSLGDLARVVGGK
jgi:hypothetical protein